MGLLEIPCQSDKIQILEFNPFTISDIFRGQIGQGA